MLLRVIVLNICSAGLETNKMSLALQLSAENVSDTEDVVDSSSTLADLVAMFPSLDHEVAVMVLEAHNGYIEAAVGYLMSTNGEGRATKPSVTRYARLDPAYDMVGQFSADIGGLPEVLPRCLYDDFTPRGRREEEEGSGGGGALGRPVEIGSDHLPEEGTLSWLTEYDPLPTYSEACKVPSSYTPVDYSPPGSEASAGGDHSSITAASGKPGSPGHNISNKKKGKKLFKIASKLNPRKKSSGGKYKVVQEKFGSGDGHEASQQYQPLIDDDQLQEENS